MRVVDAFAQGERRSGERRSGDERSEGGDERPEVRLPAVAEGALGVTMAGAAMLGDNEEQVVRGVGERVGRLSGKSRRPRNHRCSDLRECDDKVRDHSGPHGPALSFTVTAILALRPRLGAQRAWGDSVPFGTPTPPPNAGRDPRADRE
jgi:hypothetical protein